MVKFNWTQSHLQMGLTHASFNGTKLDRYRLNRNSHKYSEDAHFVLYEPT